MPSDDLLYICEICGYELSEQHHCKAVCPNCGRMFDCSDLPIMRANARIHDDQTMELAPGHDVSELLPATESTGTPALPESDPLSDSTIMPAAEQTEPPKQLNLPNAPCWARDKDRKRSVEDLP